MRKAKTNCSSAYRFVFPHVDFRHYYLPIGQAKIHVAECNTLPAHPSRSLLSGKAEDSTSTRIRHEKDGKGLSKTYVLLGGLGMAWFDWADTAALLSHYGRVLIVDRPGSGESPLEQHASVLRSSPLAHEAWYIHEVCRQLKCENIVLVAHSMASFIAEVVGRLFPHDFRAIVLLDGSCELDIPTIKKIYSHHGRPRLHDYLLHSPIVKVLPRLGITMYLHAMRGTYLRTLGGKKESSLRRKIMHNRAHLDGFLRELRGYWAWAWEAEYFAHQFPLHTPSVFLAARGIFSFSPSLPWRSHWLTKSRAYVQKRARSGDSFSWGSFAGTHLALRHQPHNAADAIIRATQSLLIK